MHQPVQTPCCRDHRAESGLAYAADGLFVVGVGTALVLQLQGHRGEIAGQLGAELGKVLVAALGLGGASRGENSGGPHDR